MTEGDDSQVERRYLEEISDIPILTGQEEYELFGKIEQGDDSARNKVIRANLRYVIKASLEFKGKGTPISDLISEGNLGLFHAINKFDRTKGFRFLSYAGHWIEKYIRQAIDRSNPVAGIPAGKQALLNKLKNAQEELEGNLGRKPSLEQLADYLDATPKEVLEVMGIPYEEEPIDKLKETKDKEMLPLHEILGDKSPNRDACLIQEEESERLRLILSRLSPNQRKVMELHFGLGGKQPLNLQQISQELNISGERVRQLKEAGLKNLRQKFPLKST